jgi:hypothetical protein
MFFVDIVKDVASKVLDLVYECGDKSHSCLVNQLLDQLTLGCHSVAQVTSDTKLFEEGALRKSPAGENNSLLLFFVILYRSEVY